MFSSVRCLSEILCKTSSCDATSVPDSRRGGGASNAVHYSPHDKGISSNGLRRWPGCGRIKSSGSSAADGV